MQIFVFSDGKRHGCYVYREEIPLEALERRGHVIDGGLHPPKNYLGDNDLFIFPRFAGMDYPLVADDLKRNGKPLVYEMDDAADLFERHHTSYFQVRNLLPSYYYFLREAEMVTTTTPQLAEHLRTLGAKNVVVLPNCPAPTPWAPLRPRDTKAKVRIGYTGWTAHMLEAAFWMEVMAALRQLRQDFTPVLFGVSTPKSLNGPNWIAKCYEAVNQNPIPNQDFGEALATFERAYAQVAPFLEWHPMTEGYDDYHSTLDHLRLDIGCAPLLDTPFNRCKSCVKFYDYAGAGALTVASDVLPYNTEPTILVPNQIDAWVRMLSLQMDSLPYRLQKTEDQRAWIRRERDADKWAVTREAAYLSLLPMSKQEEARIA